MRRSSAAWRSTSRPSRRKCSLFFPPGSTNRPAWRSSSAQRARSASLGSTRANRRLGMNTTKLFGRPPSSSPMWRRLYLRVIPGAKPWMRARHASATVNDSPGTRRSQDVRSAGPSSSPFSSPASSSSSVSVAPPLVSAAGGGGNSGVSPSPRVRSAIAANREVADDRLDQLVRRGRVPHEVALEVGQGRLPVVDHLEEELQGLRCRVRMLHALAPFQGSARRCAETARWPPMIMWLDVCRQQVSAGETTGQSATNGPQPDGQGAGAPADAPEVSRSDRSVSMGER